MKVGFPGGSDDKNLLQHRRPRFDTGVGKIFWNRDWQPTSVFLHGESHGQTSRVGYSPWHHKELDTTEQLKCTHIDGRQR